MITATSCRVSATPATGCSAPDNAFQESHLMDAIFRVDGNRVTTSPNAAGPWDPNMQHGSPAAALVTWAAEAIATPVPMRIARVSVDLMRPVAPLTIETEILREGRKIQLCAIRLRAAG